MLFCCRCPPHQPLAEHVRVAGVETVGDGNDEFQTVHIHARALIDTDAPADLVIVQRVRSQYAPDGVLYRSRRHIEQPGYLRRTHPDVFSGGADFLSCNLYYIPFHGVWFRGCL